jgi:hypothetical protein
MAEALEEAAKAENISFIREHNAGFIETAVKFVTDIEALLRELNSAANKLQKDKPDAELLKKLSDACNEYSMNGAEKFMDEIETYNYTDDGGLVLWLRENVDLMNYSEIVERIKSEE